jgi:hypothetical protein
LSIATDNEVERTIADIEDDLQVDGITQKVSPNTIPETLLPKQRSKEAHDDGLRKGACGVDAGRVGGLEAVPLFDIHDITIPEDATFINYTSQQTCLS